MGRGRCREGGGRETERDRERERSTIERLKMTFYILWAGRGGRIKSHFIHPTAGVELST
jgi:hypothetical protein